MSVCLYPINVKTAEPIGPEFIVGPRVNPRKGLWMIEFSKINKENLFTIEIEDGRETPLKPTFIIFL